MKNCLVEYNVNVPVKNVAQLSFSIDNCSVTTENDAESTTFKISILCQLKNYQSITDSTILVRAKYLSILGIISFLIDEPLDVFGHSSHKKIIDSPPNLNLDAIYIKENTDHTQTLSELMNKIIDSTTHEKEFIFSLLDRWRKARYLEKETEENLIFNDEATLSYFHVLELLGNTSSSEIKNDSKILTEEFLRKYNDMILSLPSSTIENEVTLKTKLISSILDKDISVYSKITYLLKKYELFDERTSYWIKNLIESRNSVAHGRRVYYSKAIYPVQPFFPLISNDIYPLYFLRIFIAKVIANYLGIKSFESDWIQVHAFLNPGEYATKTFLSSKQFEQPHSLSGLNSSIVFGGLNELVLSKKIKISNCIEFYKFYLKSKIDMEKFVYLNSHALSLLLDLPIDDNVAQCIFTTFKLINSSGHKYHTNFRDLFYDLDFHNFKANKLEDLISSRDLC
ncbi:hypothetical protein [Providencia sp. PROV197]|uniref:hypothetical protein n=1 Tax=Providencia sp. PROV197 TaxID=2949898 RepID=UPI00234B3FBF|nr:hypothetical protein [Providencia sp. PROV197]